MDTFLNNLKKEGWIKKGIITVDYDKFVVEIQVILDPTRPIDNILIVYDQSKE